MAYLDDALQRFKKSMLPRVGASGTWEEDKPSILSLVKKSGLDKNNAQVAAKDTTDAATKKKDKKRTAAERAAQLVPSTSVPETSKIDSVTDRYSDMYIDSQKALKQFSDNKLRGPRGGGTDATNAYNSLEMGQLIAKNKQAFRLLRHGSFADNANQKLEARSLDAAKAQQALADIPYKQNIGKAAISNANLGNATERRKLHESQVAEAYLNSKKKKKPLEIDLNDINSAFPQ